MMGAAILNERGSEEWLSEPAAATRETLAQMPGDVTVLGAGGKMGPTLAMMVKKAGPAKAVYAVSRFSNAAIRERIEARGVTTIEADLVDESAYGGRAERPVPGGHEVRSHGQPAADLGDERPRARARCETI